MSLHSHTDYSPKGATRMSFEGEMAPRAVVAKIMREFPTAGFEEVMRKGQAIVKRNPDKYLEAFVDYAITNAWRALRDLEKEPAAPPRPAAGATPPPPPSPGQSAADRIAAAERRHAAALAAIKADEARPGLVADAIEKLRAILFLDLPSPFLSDVGQPKLWRNCSVTDLGKAGEDQKELAKRLRKNGTKPSALLGDVVPSTLVLTDRKTWKL